MAALRQTKPDPHFDFSLYLDFGDALGLEICLFRSEVECYKHLEPLQGCVIPTCLRSGTLILPGRTLFPHGLLLEHIPDAVALKDIEVEPQKSVLTSLIGTVDAFGGLGVSHNGIKPHQCYVQPTR